PGARARPRDRARDRRRRPPGSVRQRPRVRQRVPAAADGRRVRAAARDATAAARHVLAGRQARRRLTSGPMTEIRSILLHLDARPGSASRLAVAHALADRHGAEVTALFGVRPDPAQASFAYSASAALHAAAERAVPSEGERERLKALAEAREPECVWCDVVGDSIVHAFIAEAAYADLVVLGAPTGGDEGGPP